MNARSASPADPKDSAAGGAERILVWDAPVRVVHWLTALCFAGAWLTAESERWRLLHVSLGYTVAALVVFRLLWGLIGTRHARFASFVRGPKAVLRYAGSLLRGQPEHHTGHNPAGGWAILALLGGLLLITATGWATYEGLWDGATEDLHEALATAVLALVGVHVAAVLLSSRLHGEKLVQAMLDGHKTGAPQQAIRRAWTPVAAVVLLAAGSFGVWQWTHAPQAGSALEADSSLPARLAPADDGNGAAGATAQRRQGLGGNDNEDADDDDDRRHDRAATRSPVNTHAHPAG